MGNANANQYFDMAENFKAKGDLNTAVQMYNEALNINPEFGLVHFMVADLLLSKNNPQGAYEAFKHFISCPLTGITIDLLPQARQKMAELEKQFQGQPQVKK